MAATAKTCHKDGLRDEVVDRLRGDQMISFIQSQGFELHQNGGEYKFLCPFHNDHKPSMCFNPRKGGSETGLFWCFSCATGGDIFQFIGLLHGLPNFKDQLNYLAKALGVGQVGGQGVKSRGPSSKPIVRKDVVKGVEPEDIDLPIMTPGEVLEVYREYKKRAMDSAPYAKKLGLDPRSWDLLGAVVAPYLHSADRIVLVVPQRTPPDGILCSLRFRCFETKKRWSLDEKKNGKKTKRTTAGLMTTPEFFETDQWLGDTITVIVEGETDLSAGLTMSIQRWGIDQVEWSARWLALPGANSCHDLVLACAGDRMGGSLSPVCFTFLDDDHAGRTAVFDHRRQRKVGDTCGPDGSRTPIMTKNLDEAHVPGLLRKLKASGRTALACFPPPHPTPHPKSMDKKYDLRDMIVDRWDWTRFKIWCCERGTADIYGHHGQISNHPQKTTGSQP